MANRNYTKEIEDFRKVADLADSAAEANRAKWRSLDDNWLHLENQKTGIAGDIITVLLYVGLFYGLLGGLLYYIYNTWR